MLYTKVFAVLFSLQSCSGFAIAGASPAVNARTGEVAMKSAPGNMMAGAALAFALAAGTPTMVNAAVEPPAVVQQAGASFVAAVPESTGETNFGIGANSPSWDGKDGEGTAPIFALAVAGFASILSRNGSGGLSPSTGGWDDNKAGRSKRGRGLEGPRTTPNGVEKVRFPVDGGAGRSATGQQGVGLLLAGVFPTFLEISRVMNLPVA